MIAFEHQRTNAMHEERFFSNYCFVWGLMGGFGSMYLNIHVPKDLWSKVFEAAITAAVSTFMGLVVKAIWSVTKAALREYIRSFKRTKSK